MKTIPLAVPEDLHASVHQAARETHLSMQDVLRQSVRLGLPQLRAKFSAVERGSCQENWDDLLAARRRKADDRLVDRVRAASRR
jgi:GrpB-like predicted nucleotidyltransferase (UPF0157 family)